MKCEGTVGLLSWVEVDLDAIRHNYRQLRSRVSPSAEMFAVVKADAYGHGAVPVAQVVLQEGAAALCVARVEEARELRRAGIKDRIIVFAPPLPAQAATLVELDCEGTICAQEHVEAISQACRLAAKQLKVHVKVDVGMGRLGVRPDDALEFTRYVRRHAMIEIVGVFGHLPCADTHQETLTRNQISMFHRVRETLSNGGLRNVTFHLANSAAILDYPEAHFDAVRPGISLYGQLPSFEVKARPDLHPAMNLKSRVIFVKQVPAGTGLSYGHTFITQRESRIATVPLGYADGYPRHASNRTRMAIGGQLVPQVGRVCMDFCLLDVTDLPNVSIGEEVLAFGKSGNVLLPVEKVAQDIGTIGYELTTRIGHRLPRVYLPQSL
ncbi:MAG: alanine racemase [Candidatus Sumerlaeaceae bacterium]|nr:alanine racemase [Candidatus Sumerlaeaceae bacterium]